MNHTMQIIKINLLLLILAGISLGACRKKEEETPQMKTWLMTLDFKDDYINPKLGAIVFVSDAAGKSLADTLVAGNSRFGLSTARTVSPPFQVTIVTWEPDMHNFRVTVRTFKYVFPAQWTLRGHRLVSTDNATVNLLNVPVHSGPVLYANSGYSNLTFATSGTSLPVYRTPDTLLVGIKTTAGPLYARYPGILPGGTFDVDLAGMTSAAEHTISLPFMAQDFHVKIYGYHDTGSAGDLAIATDEQIGNGDKTGAVSVSYPPATFNSFLTSFEAIDSWTSPSSYLYRKYGAIPDSFVKLDATTEVTLIDRSRTTFRSTGNFTSTSATWNFHDADKLEFDWTVEGPDSITYIALPELPPSMKMMFPTLSLDSMQLFQFELTRYPAFSSYHNYLEKVYGQEVPGGREKLEAISVRIKTD